VGERSCRRCEAEGRYLRLEEDEKEAEWRVAEEGAIGGDRKEAGIQRAPFLLVSMPRILA
jgi:hypothetical protein